jgi:hypothetical protein
MDVAYTINCRTLATEIDDIRAGRWDDKIAQELGISSQSTETAVTESQEYEDPLPMDALKSAEASALQEAVGAREDMLEDGAGDQIQVRRAIPASQIVADGVYPGHAIGHRRNDGHGTLATFH